MTRHAVLGTFARDARNRMIQDAGLHVLIEEQRVGRVPVVFQSQRDAMRRIESLPPWERRAPSNPVDGVGRGSLLLVTGQMTSQTVVTTRYISDTPGVRPTRSEQVEETYHYLLADDDWHLCHALRRHVEGSSLVLELDTRTLHEAVEVVVCDAHAPLREDAPRATLTPGATSTLRLPLDLLPEDAAHARLEITNAHALRDAPLPRNAPSGLPATILSLLL